MISTPTGKASVDAADEKLIEMLLSR